MKPLRLEYKFLIPVLRIEELRRAINPFVYLDEYAEREINKEYTVHSIYFDTMKLDDYHDKLAGIKIRKKLRIRGYNEIDEQNIAFLEIKRKYENHISKNRAPLFFKNLEEILNTADCDKYVLKKSNYIDAVNDARKFFYLSKIKNCSPVALINYEREAYFSKHDTTLRITFDKNLRSSSLPQITDLYNEAGLKYAMPGNFILEVKFFSGFPEWLQKILRKFELKRQAVSKYTICVESHKELRKFIDGNNILLPSNLKKTRFNYLKEEIKHAG
ncbi:MAG: polyphosphate polymerase domain-containing protein [Ignavibacterium sp.]|nr:polyphosphate polymerase domain-containing protein [Ignavibacterium sp.]